MSEIVLDSGVYIASVFPDERLNAQAKVLLKNLENAGVTFAAPYLLSYELIAVTRKAVYQSRITAEEGINLRDILLQHPVKLYYDEKLLERAYEIATEYNRPTAYDSQYLAVMEHLSCDFWTADERLFNTVKSKLPSVKWLGNYT